MSSFAIYGESAGATLFQRSSLSTFGMLAFSCNLSLLMINLDVGEASPLNFKLQ
jgi:hypothetical protein